MITTDISSQKCRKCGHIIEACSSIAGDYKPKAGDYSMCIACGDLTVFNGDLTLRAPNPVEAEQMLKHKLLLSAQLSRASEIGDRIKDAH